MVEQPLLRAVAALEAAVAAAGEEIHDVVAAALGIVAADAEIARGAGGRREQPVGDRLVSAANTASAMRWLTSAAQPETGRGYLA